MAHVVESVQIRHARIEGEVRRQDYGEHDEDGERRSAIAHEMGVSPSHSSHHSIVEKRRWRYRHGVHPPWYESG